MRETILLQTLSDGGLWSRQGEDQSVAYNKQFLIHLYPGHAVRFTFALLQLYHICAHWQNRGASVEQRWTTEG